MGYEGNWDIYKCDMCEYTAHIPPHIDIANHPTWTNQKWTAEDDGRTFCDKCSKKRRDLTREEKS